MHKIQSADSQGQIGADHRLPRACHFASLTLHCRSALGAGQEALAGRDRAFFSPNRTAGQT